MSYAYDTLGRMTSATDSTLGKTIAYAPDIRGLRTQMNVANGEMVVQPSNTKEWFDFDATPRHKDVTALICGVGADLTADLSRYEADQLNRVFYINPANTGGKMEMLHNHAVMFRQLPMPERAVNLDKEIRKVVENGDFIDMRHLLDSSKVTRAFIGVSYIQAFRQDITD